ncbi:MAG: hypothetical protein Q9170_007975 [Blastenia crenularia]
MQSLHITKYSKPSEYVIGPLSKPTVSSPQDVLIKVHAASINPIDVKVASGMTKQMQTHEFPFKIGYDASGTIEEVGSSVTEFKPGDEVFTRLPESDRGSVSEYVVTSTESIARKPTNLSHVEAASIPLVSMTALQALKRGESAVKGGTVFVTGGLSGTGSMACQLAKNNFGAEKVITTVSTAKVSKVDELLGKGVVDQIVDYKKVNPSAEIARGSVDFLFDTTGEALRFMPLVKSKTGYIVSISTIPSGDTMRTMLAPSLPAYFRVPLNLLWGYGQWWAWWYDVSYEYLALEANKKDLTSIGGMLEQRSLKPIVGHIAKFSDEKAVKEGCEMVYRATGGVGNRNDDKNKSTKFCNGYLPANNLRAADLHSLLQNWPKERAMLALYLRLYLVAKRIALQSVGEGSSVLDLLVASLSLVSCARLPPYNNVFEKIADQPRQLLRQALKYLGQYPSKDVRILNNLFKDLHLAILGRSTTGTRIDYALVSFPSLPGLYEEDILDALYFYGVLPETGWLSAVPPNAYNHPHTALAGFAGCGHGLCRNYTDIEACEAEEAQMPDQVIYTVEFTNTSLQAHWSHMSVARLAYEPYDAASTLTSFDLGYANLAKRSDKDVFWAEVVVFLAQFPRKFQHEGAIGVLNLLGDGIKVKTRRDLTFADLVLFAVLGFQDAVPIYCDDDPEFSAARGARELALRWTVRHAEESPSARLSAGNQQLDDVFDELRY